MVIAGQRDGLDVVKEPRLREMLFGEWEGLTWMEIQKREPDVTENWSKILMEVGPPGGENLPRFRARLQEAVSENIQTHPDGTVLLGAHAGTLMSLICLILNHLIEKYWQFRIDKASLSEIEIFTEGAIINHLNETRHLDDELEA